MAEHYEDPEMNTYDEHQPGSNVIPSEGNISRVYLKNVPDTLNLNGIRNLCSDYGTVISVHKPPNSVNYVFVEFTNPAEAQFCIEEVNKKFHKSGLRAAFAKTKRDDYVLPPPIPPPMPRSKDSNKIFLNPRRFNLQFVKPSYLTLGPIEPQIDEEFYKANLSEIDPTGLYFNEISVCDVLWFEDDVDSVVDTNENFQLVDNVWIFKPDDNQMEKLKRLFKEVEVDYDPNERKLIVAKGNYQPKALSKFGRCKVCGRRTLRTAKDTGEFFCLKTCAEKYLVDKIDESDQPDPQHPKSLIPGQVNNNCLVEILSVVAQNVIYIRQTDSRTTYLYHKTLDQVNASSRAAEPYQTLPGVGELIAVKLGDNYYRALVLKNCENLEVRVSLLDTGAVTVKKLEHCVRLSPNLANLPILATKVELRDVPVPYICHQAIKSITSLMLADKNKELIIKWSDNEGFLGDLFLVDKSINEQLCEMINIEQPKFCNIDLFDSDLPSIRFASEEDCELIIMDNSMLQAGALSVMLSRHLNKLRNIHDKVQYFGRCVKKERFAPRSNELCVIDIDGIWYRGLCVETAGDQHPSILCVDFGFVSIINIENIVTISEKLLDVCCTQTCEIANFPTTLDGDKLKEAQKELNITSKIKVERIEECEENNKLILYSKQLENILKKYEKDPKEIPEK